MLIKSEIFLKSTSHRLIFFLNPYGTSIKKVRVIIKSLNRAGFSVVAYEYPLDIFKTGEPERLFQVIEENRKHIQRSIKDFQKQGYNEFGFVGSSLGAFVAYNCLRDIPELQWGVMITGGSVLEAVWSFKDEREMFQSKGYTKESLAAAWHNLQYADLGDLHGKHYIGITSQADKTTPYKYAIEAFSRMQTAGAKIDLIVQRRLDHRSTVIRNLLRLNSLVRKVRR